MQTGFKHYFWKILQFNTIFFSFIYCLILPFKIKYVTLAQASKYLKRIISFTNNIILNFAIKIDFVSHFLIHDISIYLQQNQHVLFQMILLENTRKIVGTLGTIKVLLPSYAVNKCILLYFSIFFQQKIKCNILTNKS